MDALLGIRWNCHRKPSFDFLVSMSQFFTDYRFNWLGAA
jgi:hypothetical protein